MNKLQIKITDYEERIALLTNEIKRLTSVVDDKISTGYKSESELADYRMKSNQFANENEQLRRRLTEMRELSGKIEEYEIKFVGVTHEITRVNNELEEKNI